MKYRSIVCTIILLMVLSITVGFSAFVSEMSISKIVADVRLNEDVRITSVEYLNDESYNVIFNEFDYDKDSLIGNVTFNSSDAYATYKVTVTNFGNIDVCVFNYISDNMIVNSYDYGSNVIVDALGGTNELTVKVNPKNSSTGDSSFKVDVDFRKLFSVSYEHINMKFVSPNDIVQTVEGEDLFFTLGIYDKNEIEVYMNGLRLVDGQYSYETDEIYIYNVSGDVLIKGPKTLNSVMMANSALDTNVNFGSSTGLDTINNTAYTRNGTQNNEYPIYYYRGNVAANNVIFNNVCWKMVRTTNKGGVKLVYNGVPSADGSCNNTGTASQIGTSKFNPEYTSFAYHGYKYGDVYELLREDVPTDETIVFGTGISYDDDTDLYTLTNTLTSSGWENDRETIGTSYRYTCLNDSGVCSEVYYISHASKISIDYIILSSGDTYVNVLMKMLRNNNSSLVKSSVDNWYSENMTNVTSLLENEKWCNDRSVISGGWSVNPTDFYLKDSYFGAYVRNYDNYAPSLECSASNNMLYVGGGLTYPVGLLTADELTLAGTGSSGYSKSSFLYTGSIWWTMTPWKLSSNMAYNAYVNNSGSISGAAVVGNVGVRPSIVLLKNMKISSGNGSASNPYRVKAEFSVDGVNYEYEPGMTWYEWLMSDYAGFSVTFMSSDEKDAQMTNDEGHLRDGYDFVLSSYKIDSSLNYGFYYSGGSGD